MSVKVISYLHEYDEPDWYYERVADVTLTSTIPQVESKKVPFTSHVIEGHYAVRTPEYLRTDENGNLEDYGVSTNTWHIDGTTLAVYSREDINGIIGLLEKLRDQEFPTKEIETFGD